MALAATGVSGQQPNRNRQPEPYVAPLLPAAPAWTVTLTAPPAAGGAMDARHVYIPLQNATVVLDEERVVSPGSASIAALDRETGAIRWTLPLETAIPPVVGADLLFVAAAGGIQALAAASGLHQWTVPLAAPVRGPMLLRDNLLIALTEPDRLVALRVDTRELLWERVIGADVPMLMAADERAVYVSAGSRLLCVRLTDGSISWTRDLEGTLSEPAVGRDRVFVGSDANAFWALSPDTGRDEWKWDGRYFGGDVIGAAAEDDVVYVASLDNMVRALNRGNGNQRWREEVGRPAYPPRAFFGTVVVIGLSPTVSTFVGKTGTLISSWSAPTDAELQGPPLIDEHLRPFRVAMVVITRDGVVTALRPTAMMFAEPAAVTPTTLPGRPLAVERLSPDLEYLLQTLPPPAPSLIDPFGTLVALPGRPLAIEPLPAPALNR